MTCPTIITNGRLSTSNLSKCFSSVFLPKRLIYGIYSIILLHFLNVLGTIFQLSASCWCYTKQMRCSSVISVLFFCSHITIVFLLIANTRFWSHFFRNIDAIHLLELTENILQFSRIERSHFVCFFFYYRSLNPSWLHSELDQSDQLPKRNSKPTVAAHSLKKSLGFNVTFH